MGAIVDQGGGPHGTDGTYGTNVKSERRSSTGRSADLGSAIFGRSVPAARTGRSKTGGPAGRRPAVRGSWRAAARLAAPRVLARPVSHLSHLSHLSHPS